MSKISVIYLNYKFVQLNFSQEFGSFAEIPQLLRIFLNFFVSYIPNLYLTQ